MPRSLPESNVFIERFDHTGSLQRRLRNPTLDAVADDDDFAEIGPWMWPPGGESVG